MIFSLDREKIPNYVANQLNMFFPDGVSVLAAIESATPTVLSKLEASFSHVRSRYYQKEGFVYFNHLNTDHYASFLYLLSNAVYQKGDELVAEKLFALNKALHSFDAFYAITLPEVFLLVHPVGTVLGNANYSNKLVVYQNVTVGSDVNGVYPTFSTGAVLYSGVTVIGDVQTGSNVVFGANTFAKGKHIESNSIVVGQYPQEAVKRGSPEVVDHYFR